MIPYVKEPHNATQLPARFYGSTVVKRFRIAPFNSPPRSRWTANADFSLHRLLRYRLLRYRRRRHSLVLHKSARKRSRRRIHPPDPPLQHHNHQRGRSGAPNPLALHHHDHHHYRRRCNRCPCGECCRQFLREGSGFGGCKPPTITTTRYSPSPPRPPTAAAAIDTLGVDPADIAIVSERHNGYVSEEIASVTEEAVGVGRGHYRRRREAIDLVKRESTGRVRKIQGGHKGVALWEGERGM